ncbi:tectonic-3 isoform X1 [Phalacrocorax carbo]|uniref:tectonic-3 isoform X1 n=1 Tax=Phalacrocorax carbo TaxID=9209 RepID=UPI0031191142
MRLASPRVRGAAGRVSKRRGDAMCGFRGLLLSLLLARLAACSPGTPAGATAAALASGAAQRAAPRSEEAASRRARAARAGAPVSAARPRRGGPAPPLRRRRAAGDSPAHRSPPGACGLRDRGAAASSRLSGGSRSGSQVCVEKSLLFRSNTPYPTDTVAVPGGHDLLFCVQLDDSKLNHYQQPQDIKESDFLKFLEKYGRHSFLAPSQVQPSLSTFYRAGDPILTYFDSSSVLNTLRQPVKMGASGLCVDGNPAGFLDSKSTSCTRIFANLSKSCVTDPALDAASYYRDFTVLKVPVSDTIVESMKVKVTAVAPPGAPHMKDNTCNNVVSEVNYEIEFSGTHGIQSVSVRFKVSNISGNSGSSLQQHFTLHFWTRTLSHTLPRSGNPGYITGAPLLIANSGATQHMSVLQSEGDGSCSQFLRHTVQFGRNMRTGCKLSLSPILEESNCSYIQKKLYTVLQGMNRVEDLAITGSAHPTQAEAWTTILIQNCSVQAVNCTSCCMVPVTLEIQLLWSKVGLLSNPQAQILGARYFYRCHPLKSHKFCLGSFFKFFLHNFALKAIFHIVSREVNEVMISQIGLNQCKHRGYAASRFLLLRLACRAGKPGQGVRLLFWQQCGLKSAQASHETPHSSGSKCVSCFTPFC